MLLKHTVVDSTCKVVYYKAKHYDIYYCTILRSKIDKNYTGNLHYYVIYIDTVIMSLYTIPFTIYSQQRYSVTPFFCVTVFPEEG